MKNDSIKRVISLLMISFSILFVGIIVLSSSYSVMTGDDFSHGALIGARNIDFLSYFKASINYAVYVYNTWQGTYFSMFLQALLSPANNGGLAQISIEMVVSNLLLFGSLAYLIFKCLKFENNSLLIKSVFYFLITATLTVFITYYYEAYYWFSGATSYTFPLSFCLFGLSFNIEYINTKKDKYLILSCLCGLCSGGGSLTVAGLGCYSVLVLAIYDYLNNKVIDKKEIVIFVVWLLGALINTLGPGNYVRASSISNSMNLTKALSGSVIMVLLRCKGVLLDTPIVFELLVCIVLGYYFGSKNNINNNMICSILYALLAFVVSFPVCLATGGPNTSSRLCFVTDFAIYISSFLLAYVFGCFLKDKQCGKILNLITVIVFIITAIFIRPNNIVNVTTNLVNGSYIEYRKEYKIIVDSLDEKAGEDVVIKKDIFPENLKSFMNFELDEDPTFWVNEGIASFYNLNSIRLEG